MATDKRSRQKELRNTRLEAARLEAEKVAKRRRVIRFMAPILAVAVVVVLISIFSGSDKKSNTASKSKKTTTTLATGTTLAGETTTTGSGAKAVTLTGPGGGATLSGDTPCPKLDGSSTRTTGFAKAPPASCTDPTKTYTATFDTTKGKMVVTLDAKDSPKTVNNFVVLSLYHFYDGTPFFRLVKDFAAQFGDPSTHPSNAAQFGYTIPDELPTSAQYKVGTLAMANTGSPNTGGAQAFFITGAQGVSLPNSYAIVGQVTEGLDVLQAINAVPSVTTSSNDGAPTEQVTINKITIAES